MLKDESRRRTPAKMLASREAAERETETMPVEIMEGESDKVLPTTAIEDSSFESLLTVEYVAVGTGKRGGEIGLLFEGADHALWVSTSRSSIEEVCRCFEIQPPAKGETFDESTLVGKVGMVRVAREKSLRMKIDALLPATEAKPDPAPVAQDGEVPEDWKRDLLERMKRWGGERRLLTREEIENQTIADGPIEKRREESP